MTKVVHVIDNLGIGGAQRQLIETLRRFPHEAFESVVVTMDDEKNDHCDEVLDMGIPLKVIGQSGRFDFQALRQLRRLFTEFNPDIIHTWLFTADLYGWLAAGAAGSAVRISAIRSSDKNFPWHYQLVYRLIAKNADAIIVNADATREGMNRAMGIPYTKMHTVHNGMSLERFPPPDFSSGYREEWQVAEDTFVVAIVARLSAEKDHALFLEAAALTLKKHDNICFLVVGDGAERERIEAMIKQLGIGSKVRMLGARNDVWSLLNSIDLVVLTSFYEGCSNVIMEAMAASRPVIATAVGGNPELVSDGETGTVLNSRSPQELCNEILKMANAPEAAQSMGRAGRARIESEFTMERTVEKTCALYRQVLKARAIGET